MALIVAVVVIIIIILLLLYYVFHVKRKDWRSIKKSVHDVSRVCFDGSEVQIDGVKHRTSEEKKPLLHRRVLHNRSVINIITRPAGIKSVGDARSICMPLPPQIEIRKTTFCITGIEG